MYAFDPKPKGRRFCALPEIERGGAFEYRTKPEFRVRVRELTGWLPLETDPYFGRLPLPGRGEKPCIGFTVRWKLVKRVNIRPAIRRFPRMVAVFADSTSRKCTGASV